MDNTAEKAQGGWTSTESYSGAWRKAQAHIRVNALGGKREMNGNHEDSTEGSGNLIPKSMHGESTMSRDASIFLLTRRRSVRDV